MTYVFDIDGTICYTNGGDYEESVPRRDRIEKINKLYEEGNRIIFHTARGMGRSNNCISFAIESYREFTENQLEEWGVKYHALFLGKPSGDIYIDDKGIIDEDFFAN
jgi:hypothetical protein|tara:strand:+ start:252 stop:572 length:321 start_codon:yes stop_codon:yes gene_type:complete